MASAAGPSSPRADVRRGGRRTVCYRRPTRHEGARPLVPSAITRAGGIGPMLTMRFVAATLLSCPLAAHAQAPDAAALSV